MIKTLQLFFVFLLTCQGLAAQNRFTCYVKDFVTHEPLQSVTVTINDHHLSAVSDAQGMVSFPNQSTDLVLISFSIVGYDSFSIFLQLPQTQGPVMVYLKKSEKVEEAVIISSSRTNSRIEDLPTKVEVLGSEEVDEEAGTIPGNIASLLGDVAGIQNQRSSATTGSIDLRVQGLPGKYTQLLRDGLPLYGDYGGSFSVLQIPPLDLKQVEIVKGASSTLYGGGAIAGMINLVSKTPKRNDPQHVFLINRSSLTETNINTFHSGRNEKTGYTIFAGTTLQRAVDVNKDGFSDVPDLTSFFLHPKFFWYPNKKNTLTLEYNGTYEDRNGGDMQVLHHSKDNVHRFFIRNISWRHTIAGTWEDKLNNSSQINFKGSYSFYSREISTPAFGMKAQQPTFFTELTYLKKWKQHTLVAGLNFSGESFNKRSPDSSGINPYSEVITGVFAQDDWKPTPKLTIQTGLRFDYNSDYEPVLLPRLSLLYKFNQHFTSRLGGGMGYKAPSVFGNENDERYWAHHNLAAGINTEKSIGANWDINYKGSISNWHITVNQMFYITQISRPVIADPNGGVYYNYINAAKPLDSKGFETYVAAMHNGLEIYLGYTYTIARQLFDPAQINVPLSARSKFAAVISNEFSSRFRACVEASYTGRQYLDNGTQTPGYFISAAMMRYDIKKFSFVLNCENIFDYRQSRKESLFTGPVRDPSFKQLWAPVDGRVMNLSVRFSL